MSIFKKVITINVADLKMIEYKGNCLVCFD
jgi:hypothetical protein